MIDARELFGNIDIYLFDQILKDRFRPGMKILDAGCGGGRNLIYFLRNGFEVFGADKNFEAIEQLRNAARSINGEVSPDNFKVSAVEELPFADQTFDWVLSSAVLHFAEDENHFEKMLSEMWRVLKPSGVFFARLASDIGIEEKVKKLADRRFLLPDGSELFLVNEKMLINAAERLGGEFIEPVKTTNVQNLRCMTTWVLRKKL